MIMEGNRNKNHLNEKLDLSPLFENHLVILGIYVAWKQPQEPLQTSGLLHMVNTCHHTAEWYKTASNYTGKRNADSDYSSFLWSYKQKKCTKRLLRINSLFGNLYCPFKSEVDRLTHGVGEVS